MNTVLQQLQLCAVRLPLSAQAELLHYAMYLEQRSRDRVSAVSDQVRRDRLAAALAAAVVLNPFRDVADPVAWQREQRYDRGLPGRDDAY